MEPSRATSERLSSRAGSTAHSQDKPNNHCSGTPNNHCTLTLMVLRMTVRSAALEEARRQVLLQRRMRSVQATSQTRSQRKKHPAATKAEGKR
jgi:hypothetical protein